MSSFYKSYFLHVMSLAYKNTCKITMTEYSKIVLKCRVFFLQLDEF